MKKFLLTILCLAVGIIGAYVLFAISLFVCAIFREGFKQLDFSGVYVHATAKMQPLYLSSRDIQIPLYISVKGKYLKLDSKTTRYETKKFLENTGLDYEESAENDIAIGERFLISSGCFELYYQHDKLVRYGIFRDRNDIKSTDGICIGTSRQALFPLPLRLVDIEAMFGREYTIHEFGRFI